MLTNNIWKTIDGVVIDFLYEFKELMKEKKIVQIGTDSQQAGKFTDFVSVVAVLTPGKGGRAFYTRERISRIKSLRERLTVEVWKSVTLGLEVSNFIPNGTEFSIHVDANPLLKFKSSQYIKELTGMVVGQGFKAVFKPDSWCATHTADYIVKRKIFSDS